MPAWFTILAAIVALGGGIFGGINSYRTMKKNSPIEEIKKEYQERDEELKRENQERWDKFFEKWDKVLERVKWLEESVKTIDGELARSRFAEIEAKLDTDNRRIAALIENSKSQQRFLVLLLKAQQQTLNHMSEGNHTQDLKKVSEEIHGFLLDEATRCDL